MKRANRRPALPRFWHYRPRGLTTAIVARKTTCSTTTTTKRASSAASPFPAINCVGVCARASSLHMASTTAATRTGASTSRSTGSAPRIHMPGAAPPTAAALLSQQQQQHQQHQQLQYEALPPPTATSLYDVYPLTASRSSYDRPPSLMRSRSMQQQQQQQQQHALPTSADDRDDMFQSSLSVGALFTDAPARSSLDKVRSPCALAPVRAALTHLLAIVSRSKRATTARRRSARRSASSTAKCTRRRSGQRS